jgi:hypothetical protein
MAIRTSKSKVQGVLLSDYGPDEQGREPSLEPFIKSANVIVNRVATCATARSLTLTSDELELIETWLAAHLYVMADQNFSSKSTSGASASFQGQTGMYLEASKYGQMAMTIDYSGCLRAISAGKRASAAWIGKTKTQQLDYDERN